MRVKENEGARMLPASKKNQLYFASDRLTRTVVITFACFIGLLVLIGAFCTDRNGDVDELMMYNPSYMLAHFGKLTFPSYAYRSFYNDPVINHPPIHLGLIGLLERAGFTWYYAEAIPTVVFLLVAIVIIASSAFPAMVKLGLLSSIGFVISTGEDFGVVFGVRPEGEVYAAWLAGLVLLESGRLAGWHRTRLLVGAFILTWASGVHYYACAAFLGVVVYVLWAIHDLGLPRAESRIAALIAGGCLFGIPYVVLYLVPHLKQILMYIRMTTGNAGVATAVHIHFDQYRAWAHADYIPGLIRVPVGLGIPLAVFSTLILGAIKSTRGIALAALPLQLFVLFFAAHKLPNYLIHEVALFAGAFAVSVLVMGDWLWRRIPLRSFNRIFPLLAAAVIAYYLVGTSPTLKAAQFSTAPHVHEGDLARAATRQILGPHARVTGRDGGWYTSGADYWFDIEREMLRSSYYDPTSFFSNFDAAVDYAHQSETTEGSTISSWYASGVLKLRGFYFGDTNEQLQLVLLSTHRVPQVVGYAAQGGRVYRFEENPAGDFQVIAAACPMTAQLERGNWIDRWPETFSAALYLPKPAPGAPAVVATVLVPRSLREPAEWMRNVCHVVTALNGTLKPVDKNVLLEELRREDKPMHFPRMLEELPGYKGVILPATMTAPKESVAVEGVLRLSEIRPASGAARVERLPQIRVTTIPALGAFSAGIPVLHGEVITGPCWLELQLKVITGEIGLAAFGPHGIIASTPLSIIKSSDPIDVALHVMSLRDVNSLIIFNASHLVGAQVDLLGANVRVLPNERERYSAALSSLK